MYSLIRVLVTFSRSPDKAAFVEKVVCQQREMPCIVSLHLFRWLDTHGLLQILIYGSYKNCLLITPSYTSSLSTPSALSAHQKTWFGAFLSWLRRKGAFSALVHKMWRNKAIKIVRDASSPGFYSRLFLVPKTSRGWKSVIDISLLNTFLEIPHFKMETALTLLIPTSTLQSIRVTENSFVSKLWIPSTNSGPCRLASLSSSLGIHQDYCRDQSSGARNGHQSMLVPGRLADILDQSLRDTGQVLSICHTMALLIHEKKFDLFLGYHFNLVSFHVTPTISLLHYVTYTY